MTTIDIQKAQAFYAELALLQHSKAETNERFSHLSSFFYKLIKSIEIDFIYNMKSYKKKFSSIPFLYI
jgi:hypothetical protein